MSWQLHRSVLLCVCFVPSDVIMRPSHVVLRPSHVVLRPSHVVLHVCGPDLCLCVYMRMSCSWQTCLALFCFFETLMFTVSTCSDCSTCVFNVYYAAARVLHWHSPLSPPCHVTLKFLSFSMCKTSLCSCLPPPYIL